MRKRAGVFNTVVIFLLLCLVAAGTRAQDALPQFTAIRKPENRVTISWTNPFGNKIRQLSIQRSADSTRFFKSIVTLPDPTLSKNAYADLKSPDTLQYYRLYILLEGGHYIFGKAQRALRYTAAPPAEKPVVVKIIPSPPDKREEPKFSDNKITDKQIEKPVKRDIIAEKNYIIKRADTVKGNLPESKMRAFRDSINLYTKDTLLSVVNDTIIIRPFIPKEVFVLSKYIFTDKSGLLHIELPEAPRRSYKVRFYEEDKTFLFEVRNIRDQVLLLDKANFQHAGWFLYELLDDDKLIEKNRFFIGKDF
ncbi:MAG: hypothetical protein QM664_10695 [Flavihumibacter sp.]